MRFSEIDASFLEHSGLILVQALGEFDQPSTGSDAIAGQWFMFIITAFFSNLIVLNTLIAILGDSYDKVMD
jgi:hypothetical protein